MRGIEYVRKHLRGDQSIPLDIRVSFVRALYCDACSLVIGSVAAIVTSLFSAWKTSNPLLLLCAVALTIVFALRVLDFRAFGKDTEITTTDAAVEWELRYVVGAASHV